MSKVTVVGAGNVGATAANVLAINEVASEVVLIDIKEGLAEGKAMDIMQTAQLIGFDTVVKGVTNDYSQTAGSDVVVITSGIPRKPGMTREDLIGVNAGIVKAVAKSALEYSPNCIFIIVSNPMDILTYYAMKFSGLPSEKVIGSGTVLDSARLRTRIASYLNVNPKSVHAYQIGEHGDTELTLWSLADIGGQKVTELLDKKTRNDISNFVRDEAYGIIEKKGYTCYGIATCVVQILNSIFNDEMRVLPVSSYDFFSDTSFGFPSVVGRAGVMRRLDLKLSEHEGVELQKSINALKKAISSIKY